MHTVDKNIQEQIASCNKPIEVMQEVESLPEVVESSESEVIIADIYYYWLKLMVTSTRLRIGDSQFKETRLISIYQIIKRLSEWDTEPQRLK